MPLANMTGLMSFDEQLVARNAVDYADFLIPHLTPDAHVLDMGCGSGTISLGLAEIAGRVIGVDLDEEEQFSDARRYVAERAIGNVEFRTGDVYSLGFPDDRFDACLCHSMLEELDRPLDGLREIGRTLKPGGVLGVACVEYGGLILAGPEEPLLRRFYAIREQLWQLEHVDPYRGRELRGLLISAGFEGVIATTKYVCYGTSEAVRSFGLERAEDCRDDWYASSAQEHGLATPDDLEAMEEAWTQWSRSPEAYAAFAWCRAIGWKPNP
jgi:ubiquinone/menaquinone biosynthesis C-methylase UbiE